LVSEEDIVEGNNDDLVTDTLPQDQLRVVERPSTVFVEQKGMYNGYHIMLCFHCSLLQANVDLLSAKERS